MPFTTPASGHDDIASLPTTPARRARSPLALAIASALALAAAGIDSASAETCLLTAGRRDAHDLEHRRQR